MSYPADPIETRGSTPPPQDDVAVVRYYLNIVAEEDACTEANAALDRFTAKVRELEAENERLNSGVWVRPNHPNADNLTPKLEAAEARVREAERERDDEIDERWKLEDRERKLREALERIAEGAESNPPAEVARVARDALIEWPDGDEVGQPTC